MDTGCARWRQRQPARAAGSRRLVLALQAELRALVLAQVRTRHLDLEAQVVRAVGLLQGLVQRDQPRAVELVERLVERARAILRVRLDRALDRRDLPLGA